MENSGIGPKSFILDQPCIITLKSSEQESKVNEIKNEGFSNAHRTDIITKKNSINNLVVERNANNEIEENDITIHRKSIKTLLKGQNANNEIEQEETIEVPVYNSKGELVEKREMTKSEYDEYFTRKVFKVERKKFEKNGTRLDLL